MDPRFSPPGDGGQPAERADRAAVRRQLAAAPTSPCRPPTASCGSGAIPGWPAWAPASRPRSIRASGNLGYEWDVDTDNGFRPAGLMDMSSTTDNGAEVFTDYGSTTAAQQHGHPSPDPVPGRERRAGVRGRDRAMVVGPGQPDRLGQRDRPDRYGYAAGHGEPVRRHGSAQPATLMPGLTAATASTDTTAPTSTITSPAQNANLSDGAAMTISGTASRRRRWRGRRRRGLHRRRQHLASGHHHVGGEHVRDLELLVDRSRQPDGDDQVPGRR